VSPKYAIVKVKCAIVKPEYAIVSQKYAIVKVKCVIVKVKCAIVYLKCVIVSRILSQYDSHTTLVRYKEVVSLPQPTYFHPKSAFHSKKSIVGVHVHLLTYSQRNIIGLMVLKKKNRNNFQKLLQFLSRTPFIIFAGTCNIFHKSAL